MKKSRIAVAVIALGAFSAGAHSESAWKLNLGAGVQTYDSERNLDDSGVGFIGIERQFSDEWGVELSYMGAATESDSNVPVDIDVDIHRASLDARRYFNLDTWRPYVLVGIGHSNFKVETPLGDSSDDDTHFSLGVGARFDIAPSWSTGVELRAINNMDDDLVDGVALFSIGYAFGAETPAETTSPVPVAPAEKDTDGDGIGDSSDRCANTPVGVVVNASGCPLDTDGDGVPDYKDKCPQTPAGRQVDESGCKFVLSRTEQIRMEVNFATNSADIPEQYQPEIAKVANFLKKFGGVSAVIEGHSDSTGTDAYNKSLSQRRADAVKAALVTKFGIDASRLTAIGYGEERPVASNETREGRRENRRVVAVLKAEITE